MSLFAKKEDPIVGINIDKKLISVVSLKGKKLTNFATMATPEGVIVGSGDLNKDKIEELETAVKNCLTKAGIKGKGRESGFVILGESNIYKKEVDLPERNMPFDEVIDFLNSQNVFPKDVEEFYIDCERKRDSDDKYLVVACERDYIDDRVDMLDELGFINKLVDFELNAYLRAIKGLVTKSDREEDYDLFVLIKDKMAEAHVVKNLNAIYSEVDELDMSSAGDSDSFMFDDGEEEEDSEASDEDKAVLAHINKCLNQYSISVGGEKPKKILLAGDVSESAVAHIKKALPSEVCIANPYDEMDTKSYKKSKDFENNFKYSLPALGIALREKRNGKY